MRAAPLAAALCLALGASAAQAQQAGPLQVDVVDRHTGRSLPVYAHRGEYWVEGRPGARYGIRVNNRSGERLLAVISVDGVNVLTGDTAATDQAGYVLDPWQNSQINGWRKSSNQVAAFNFTALPNSYAARTGRPDDVGVIGVAVFDEYRRPPPVIYDRTYPRSGEANREDAEARADNAAPMAEKSARAQAPSLGTGHGRREYSHAQATQFERASSRPSAVLRLRYDSRENLIAMGVIPSQRPWRGQPDPFPGNSGYVPDPPRWR
ncbi:hypothetical protein CCO03_07595 [Comamonas serinivorans]|uniref:Uncharacterized protein n=1 Tax=Comamonas serinivorans TaxID=1082851 RepID=A0A1Y0ET02_9BURK|nr:hypothetical protein CCO03_07595 [Comamonas serinivorans]